MFCWLIKWLFIYNSMKKQFVILALFVCALSGCTCNSTFQNRESDKRDAERITDNFYAQLHLNQFDEIKSLFSDSFYKVVDTGKLRLYIKQADEEFGTITNDSLVTCESRVIRGTNAKAEYIVVYYVTRTKKNTTETFLLNGDDNGVKIVRYNINYNMGLSTPAE